MDDQLDELNGSLYYSTPALPTDQRPESSIFLGVLLFLLSAISIVGNVVTILAFRARENIHLRRKTSNLFILSLSCTDLLIGLTGLPFAAITHSLGSWPLGEAVCVIGAFFSVLGVAGGMYTLSAINIDRWLLVSREYSSYLRIQSLRNIKLQIAGTWILAVLMSSSEAIIWVAGGARETEEIIDYTKECRSPVRTDLRFAFITGFLLFVVPFIIMVVCSLRFVVLLRRRLRKPKPGISSSKPAAPQPAEPEGAGELAARALPMESPAAGAEEIEPVPSSPHPTSATTATSDLSVSFPQSLKESQSARPTEKNSARTKAVQRKKMQNRYLKPAFRLAILMSVFAFCSLPYPFFILIVDTKCSDCEAQVIARNHLSNLLLANSALNPFIYAIMHRQIRQYHAKRFRAIFYRRKSVL